MTYYLCRFIDNTAAALSSFSSVKRQEVSLLDPFGFTDGKLNDQLHPPSLFNPYKHIYSPRSGGQKVLQGLVLNIPRNAYLCFSNSYARRGGVLAAPIPINQYECYVKA